MPPRTTLAQLQRLASQQMRQKADYNCACDINEEEIHHIAPLAKAFVHDILHKPRPPQAHPIIQPSSGAPRSGGSAARASLNYTPVQRLGLAQYLANKNPLAGRCVAINEASLPHRLAETQRLGGGVFLVEYLYCRKINRFEPVLPATQV